MLTAAAAARSSQALKESAGILRAALRQLEEYWLAPRPGGGGGGFLSGADRPSIADLVLAAEVAQLSMLPRGEGAALLSGWPRVRAWLAAVEAGAAPHWAEANEAGARLARALRAPGAKL